MTLDLSPYSTAAPYFGVLPTWVAPEDQQRLATYALYEAIYRNVPDAFKIIQRGSEQNPIYVPSGKTIVEAANRFLAKRWDYAIDPTAGSETERAALSALLRDTFIREQVYSKFTTQKKWGLVRGDAIWHITADENKDLGKRVSIHERDPGSYFPIWDAVDDSKVVGCHLVDQFPSGDGGQIVIRRQTYRKEEVTGRIIYEVSWWETGGWDDRDGSGQTLKRTTPPSGFTGVPAVYLPDAVTTIPVYHVKNERLPDAPFGVSELAGLERVIGGINQSVSDQELTLALDGLGLYATTSGPPVDEDGEEDDWQVGPGYVVEIDADSTFQRVAGVGSVQPSLDHIRMLDSFLREASGTPDVAVGKVDTGVAESGVSLALQMAPLLSKNEEKEQVLLSTMDHMLYDLVTQWFPAYEQMTTEARAVSTVDDPLPTNRAAILEEVTAMLATDPPLISTEFARQILAEKLGYEFPDDMTNTVVGEVAALSTARNRDAFTARVDAELEGNEA